jgi:hypothetical protein
LGSLGARLKMGSPDASSAGSREAVIRNHCLNER